MSVRKTLHCPLCNSASIEIFFEMQNIPAHSNVLHATRDEALNTPRGNVQLGFCRECGHICNYAFDPKLMLYTQAYENSLHFSPRFQRYAEDLANDLIARYDLHAKTIIEVGCGKGDFLKLICELGENKGIGFDESYEPELSEKSELFRVIQDSYSEKYSSVNADFICCRHVLEHIESPISFVTNIRKTIGTRTDCSVYVEVPNALYMLNDLGIWDLIYEHCSYFTANSLSRLFTSCGFEVARLEEKYDGQFLGIELKIVQYRHAESRGSRESMKLPPMTGLPAVGGTRPDVDNFAHNSKVDLSTISLLVRSFAKDYHTKAETWKTHFAQFKREGKRVVVWGSGSKGVTFLNVLKQTANVEYVVDINPRKQGMYVAGAGQKVVSPEFLKDYKPDAIIFMNPIYKEEIRDISSEIGLAPELMMA